MFHDADTVATLATLPASREERVPQSDKAYVAHSIRTNWTHEAHHPTDRRHSGIHSPAAEKTAVPGMYALRPGLRHGGAARGAREERARPLSPDRRHRQRRGRRMSGTNRRDYRDCHGAPFAHRNPRRRLTD